MTWKLSFTLIAIFFTVNLFSQSNFEGGISMGINLASFAELEVKEYTSHTRIIEQERVFGSKFGIVGNISGKFFTLSIGINYGTTGSKIIETETGYYQNYLNPGESFSYKRITEKSIEFHKLGLPASIGFGYDFSWFRPEIFVGVRNDFYLYGQDLVLTDYNTSRDELNFKSELSYDPFNKDLLMPARWLRTHVIMGLSLTFFNKIQLTVQSEFSEPIVYTPKIYGFCGTGSTREYEDNPLSISIVYLF